PHPCDASRPAVALFARPRTRVEHRAQYRHLCLRTIDGRGLSGNAHRRRHLRRGYRAGPDTRSHRKEYPAFETVEHAWPLGARRATGHACGSAQVAMGSVHARRAGRDRISEQGMEPSAEQTLATRTRGPFDVRPWWRLFAAARSDSGISAYGALGQL